MEKLRTRNVFLDAEVFRSGGFNYGSTSFRTLAELAASGEICVFITDITKEEVKALIHDEVEKAVRAQQSFSQNAYILRNCRSAQYRERLKALDAKLVEKDLSRQFERFLKEAKVLVLSTRRVDVKKVFERYFAIKPPFGPGKKRKEFPDAFATAAVRDWCVKEKQEIYVISVDSDIQAVCGADGLYSIEKLSGFLDLVASHNEGLVAFVKDQIAVIEPKVIKEVEDQFKDLSFLLDDHDGDVEDVTVLGVAMGEIDILQATDEQAILETETEVTFEADLRYADEGSASYDSEDKTVFYHNYVRETVQRTRLISVEISVFYAAGDPESFEINDVSIERKTILVKPSRDGEWPYK